MSYKKEGEAARKNVSDDPVIFKEIEVTDTKMIRIWRNVYKGRELLSIQLFWKKDMLDAEWEFGKTITFDESSIPEILEGLEAMRSWCEDN